VNDTLPRIGLAAPQPDPDLIATLERMLEQARSGELGGLAYIGYLTDRNVAFGFTGPEMAGQYLRTHGLLTWLAQRAMERWESGFETS
jgi:hypothetical protein